MFKITIIQCCFFIPHRLLLPNSYELFVPITTLSCALVDTLLFVACITYTACYGFRLDLLDRCESLLLVCQVALSDFVASLKVNLPWYEQLRLDHVSTNHIM